MSAITFADALVVVGFGAAVYGSWLVVGAGPTLIATGVVLVWIGGRMYGGEH